MDRMAFFKAIVAGLRGRGMSDAEIARAAGVPVATVADVAAGKSSFSPAAVNSIESHMHMTGGQIAALALEPDGGALTDVVNALAAVHESITPAHEAPKRR